MSKPQITPHTGQPGGPPAQERRRRANEQQSARQDQRRRPQSKRKGKVKSDKSERTKTWL